MVLKQHPKAKELYQDIKDCFMLPGVEDTFSMIERKVPEGTELLKGMAKKVGYKKNSKPEDNYAIAGRRLINGTLKLIGGLKNRLWLPILISSRRRHCFDQGNEVFF